MSLDNRNDLPPVNSPNFLEKVREALSTYLGIRGDPMNRGLTVRDLADAGVIGLNPRYGTSGGRVSPVGGVGSAIGDLVGAVDFTPPPAPEGFAASAAFENLMVSVNVQTYTQGHGHGRVRLYGSTIEGTTFGDAELLMEFSGTVASYPATVGTTYHLWATNVSKDGVESVLPAPTNDVYGISAITGYDVDGLVAAQTGLGKPFTIIPTTTVIDGVTFPAGVYAQLAFIQDLQVTTAKIKELDLDNARVSKMSAAKLTAGSIAVGQYIQSTSYVAGSSGWRINGDGTAEFGAASIRGQLTASQIDSRGLSIKDGSGNIILASGTPLAVGNITGLGSLATQSSVAYSALTGTKPPTNADNTASNTAAGIAGQGAFATLSQINSGNVSTYIANAAIDTAQISELNASKITAGTITTDKIVVGAVSAPYSVTYNGIQQGLVSTEKYFYMMLTPYTTTFVRQGGRMVFAVEINMIYTINNTSVADNCDLNLMLYVNGLSYKGFNSRDFFIPDTTTYSIKQAHWFVDEIYIDGNNDMNRFNAIGQNNTITPLIWGNAYKNGVQQAMGTNAEIYFTSNLKIIEIKV